MRSQTRRALIDDVLPHFDEHEVHEARIPAPAEAAYLAVKQVTAREVRLLMTLEAVRGLPSFLIGADRSDRMFSRR